ncbi:MAG: hypothetical protein JXQ96_09355 [Cyclobacteriaceae bacterium]
MKKLIIFSVAFFAMNIAYAQKGSVSKASAYLAKENYASAKAEIDVAVTIEKNAAKSKTWFERGRIYQAIAISKDEAISSLDDQALQKTVEAYNKVQTMEKETSPNSILASTNLDNLWGTLLNDGGTVYGEEKYDEAYKKFTDALLVRPTDSITLLYAGVCAQANEKYENTTKHYTKLDDLGYASVDVYATLIYIERAINKDEEKAYEIIKKAIKKYPTEKRFGREEISVLINLKQLDAAQQKLIEQIEKDPTNADLHLNLALMYDNVASNMADGDATQEETDKQYDLALTEYLKAIEIDPGNYVGNYNAGAIYINKAKVYYDQVRDMDLATYNKKGPELAKKADEILAKGLPYMEKANESKEDVDGLRALMQMYKQLKMYDKAEKVLTKIEELEAAAGAN